MSAAGEYFQAVGQALATQLGDGAQRKAEFARIATEVLNSIPAPAINVVTMVEWTCAQVVLPKQVNKSSGFGEPPLVVYEAPDFYLEVLFWFPSRTSIHAHGFTGAFRVLHGASLQAEYVFQEDSAPEPGVRLGRLEPVGVHLITPGQVFTIRGGNDFIHTVVHLGRPSLTLVARTFGSKDFRQYSFARSGFAYDPFLHASSLTRQKEVLLALRMARPELFLEQLLGCLAIQGQHGFYMLLDYLSVALDPVVFHQQVLPAVEARFGDRMATAMAAVREAARSGSLMQMLAGLPDPQKQLQMALAELFPDRQELLDLIRHSHNVAEPADVLADWNRRIAGVQGFGESGT